MLQQLSIRKKFLLVLVGPAIGLLLLAGLTARGQLSDSGDAGDAEARARFGALTGDLIDALHDEAVINQFEANGLGSDGRDDARARTDQVRDAWLGAVAPFAGADAAGTIELVQSLDQHRNNTAATTPALAFGADSSLIDSVGAFDARVATGGEDVVRGDLVVSAELSETAALLTDAQLLGIWTAASGTVPTANDGAPDLGGRLATVDVLADGHNAAAAEGAQIAAPTDAYDAMAAAFSSLAPGELVSADPADWSEAADNYFDGIVSARQAQASSAVATAAAAGDDASGSLRTLGIVALAALAVGALAALLIGHQVAKALGLVNDEAAAIAKHDLPVLANALRSGEPVQTMDRPLAETSGADEITDLMGTINEIRQSADLVGKEQSATLQSGIADMFINLARRNQTLVDRQLEVIDQLEADERDPERLSHMYRVDHLATRMRRNAESLLVLAGHREARRRGPAVQLREVVRVAIGEVEDYRRIIPIAVDDQDVAGHIAQDLAHLLSELMENATQSSPPGTVADVIGAKEADGSYRIQVIDRGTGIEPGRLAELNALLINPPTNSLTMSRTMGLTVVGRLAQRLGLTVQLQPGADSGTVAVVTIPELVAREWRGETTSPVTDQAIQSVPGGFSGLSNSLPELDTANEVVPEGGIDFGLSDPAPSILADEQPVFEPLGAPVVDDVAPDPAPLDEPVDVASEADAEALGGLGAGLLSDDLIGDVASTPPAFGADGTDGIELPNPPTETPTIEVPGFEPQAPILESLLDSPSEPEVSIEPSEEPTPAPISDEHLAPVDAAPLVEDTPVAEHDIPAPVDDAPLFSDEPPAAAASAPTVPDTPVSEAPVFEAPVSEAPVFETPVSETPSPFDGLDAPVETLPEPPAVESLPEPPAISEPVAESPFAAEPVAEVAFDTPPPTSPFDTPPPASPFDSAPPLEDVDDGATFPPTEVVSPTPQPAEATFPAVTPDAPAAAPSAFGADSAVEAAPEPTIADVAKLTAPESAPLVPPPVVATPGDAAGEDAPETTPSGLIRRKRKAPGAVDESFGIDRTQSAAPSKRSPDQVKSMLSRYKSGLERGRTDGES